MKKRVFSVVVALALCLGLLPGRAWALSVTVAGTALENGYYTLTDGKVAAQGATEENYQIRFEKDSGTLTLNNAAISADAGQPGVLFTYESNDEEATLNLIGENTITGSGSSYGVNTLGTQGNIPSSSADVDAQLTIRGEDGASLTTSGTSWGIQAVNLTIDDVDLDMTTNGHSALRVGRDLVVRDSSITTKDSGDGGDLYVSRSIKISNSEIDMSAINVEYPSIYLDNYYCPDELKVSPAVVIEDSTLTIGGQAESSFGFMLYVAGGGAEITGSTLIAANGRAGIAVVDGTLDISGGSTINTGDQLAVRALEKAVIGEGASVQGALSDGKPLVNNGEVSLRAGVTAEQLNTVGGALYYYGGGTIKVGNSEVYHSVRVAPQGGTPLDEVEPQWVLDGTTDIVVEVPEREGYTFTGWFTDEGLTEAFDPEAPLTGSLLLYPGWERTGNTPGPDPSAEPPASGTADPQPVTTTGQGTTTTTTAAPPASVSGGKATATVDTSMGGEIVKQAVANDSKTVVIVPKVTGDVSKTEVTIPASTVGQIGSQTNASLTVSTPVADVTIPNGGLGSLSSAGGTVTVTAQQTGNSVELTVTAGGKTVQNVPGGVTLTVPATSTTSGTVAVLVREDGTREVVRKSMANGDSIIIPLDGSAKLELVDNSKTFTDVPATGWQAEAAAFACGHELFNGTAPGRFSPDAPMSRGMLAVVLHNLESNPVQALTDAFADVDNSQWYAEGVAWAEAQGIIGGYGNGRFGPNDSVTREQLAVMLWRYAGSPAATDRELRFADAYKASGWALDALRWTTENGIIKGKGDGTLDPTGQATRAETAQMLKNFMEKL